MTNPLTAQPIRGFLGALAMLLATADPAGAEPTSLTMGCTSTISSAYGYCLGAAKAIDASVGNVRASVMATGGTVDNLQRLARGEIHIGLTTTDQIYQAWKAEGAWKDHAFPDVRTLWYHGVSAVYHVVRQDSGVASIHDLTGKKFSPGARGSATEQMTETVLTALGIRPDYVRGKTEDAVQALKDGRITGYTKSAEGFRLDASMREIAAHTAIRVLGFSEQEMQRARVASPQSPWIEVPAGSVPGQGAFWTTAIVVGFVAHRRLDDQLAYRLVKAIHDGLEYQKAAFRGTVDDITKLTMDSARSPLHAGALRYYRERGVVVPAHLVPPEAR